MSKKKVITLEVLLGIAMVALVSGIMYFKSPMVTEYYWEDSKGETYKVGEIKQSRFSDDLTYTTVNDLSNEKETSSKDAAYLLIGMTASADLKGDIEGLSFKTNKVTLTHPALKTGQGKSIVKGDDGKMYIKEAGK